jgi:hypothetical protein
MRTPSNLHLHLAAFCFLLSVLRFALALCCCMQFAVHYGWELAVVVQVQPGKYTAGGLLVLVGVLDVQYTIHVHVWYMVCTWCTY